MNSIMTFKSQLIMFGLCATGLAGCVSVLLAEEAPYKENDACHRLSKPAE
jgi:hypothetical protein